MYSVLSNNFFRFLKINYPSARDVFRDVEIVTLRCAPRMNGQSGICEGWKLALKGM